MLPEYLMIYNTATYDSIDAIIFICREFCYTIDGRLANRRVDLYFTVYSVNLGQRGGRPNLWLLMKGFYWLPHGFA